MPPPTPSDIPMVPSWEGTPYEEFGSWFLHLDRAAGRTQAQRTIQEILGLQPTQGLVRGERAVLHSTQNRRVRHYMPRATPLRPSHSQDPGPITRELALAAVELKNFINRLNLTDLERMRAMEQVGVGVFPRIGMGMHGGGGALGYTVARYALPNLPASWWLSEDRFMPPPDPITALVAQMMHDFRLFGPPALELGRSGNRLVQRAFRRGERALEEARKSFLLPYHQGWMNTGEWSYYGLNEELAGGGVREGLSERDVYLDMFRSDGARHAIRYQECQTVTTPDPTDPKNWRRASIANLERHAVAVRQPTQAFFQVHAQLSLSLPDLPVGTDEEEYYLTIRVKRSKSDHSRFSKPEDIQLRLEEFRPVVKRPATEELATAIMLEGEEPLCPVTGSFGDTTMTPQA